MNGYNLRLKYSRGYRIPSLKELYYNYEGHDPPLYGDSSLGLLGFLKSVTYSVLDSSTWEHEKGRVVPKHIMVTVMYKVIHDETPSLRFAQTTGKTGINFYGINEKIGNV